MDVWTPNLETFPDLVWEKLKEQCSKEPKLAKQLTMVSRLDLIWAVREAMATRLNSADNRLQGT